MAAWKGNLVFSKEKGGQMIFTPNKILEMFAKRHGTKNKAYEILKRSMGLELSGADKRKPSDILLREIESDRRVKRKIPMS